MSGMLVSLGVGSPVRLAVCGASKIVTESGSETVDGAAKRSAKEIAELIVLRYERRGLMPDPPRTSGGHRLYEGDHLKRLNFIRRARALGFTLAQVQSLLALADSGDFACAEVKAMTESHRAEVRGKLADLRRLDHALKDLATQCEGGNTSDCAIFESLFETRG